MTCSQCDQPIYSKKHGLCRTHHSALWYTNNRERHLQTSRLRKSRNKELIREQNKKWYAMNKERVSEKARARNRYNKEARRAKHYKVRYGITLVEKEERVKSQEYRCENPGCQATDPGRHGWCTDHNHETGQLRGELCHSCNTALGFLEENPSRILGLIEYLKKYEKVLA